MQTICRTSIWQEICKTICRICKKYVKKYANPFAICRILPGLYSAYLSYTCTPHFAEVTGSPADDINSGSDPGPQYLGAPRDESASAPVPAASCRGSNDRRRPAEPRPDGPGGPGAASALQPESTVAGTPEGCRPAWEGPRRSPGGGASDLQPGPGHNLVPGIGRPPATLPDRLGVRTE